MEKVRKRASFTIEAAFILPLVFYTILFLLSYCFFCHDRSKLQAVGEEVVKKAAAYLTYSIDLNLELRSSKSTSKGLLYPYILEGEEEKNQILQYAKQRLSQGYFVSEIQDITIDTTRSNVKVKGTLKAVFPGAKLFGILHKDCVRIPFCFEENTWKREERARMFEVAITLGYKIEGVEKAMKKLKELGNKIE